jgi:hypothetical protein
MKFGATSALAVVLMIVAAPSFAATATTAPAAKAPAMAMASKAKPAAKTHYFVAQDASTKACSVVTKKPDGKTATMVGKFWYASVAGATAAMKKAAACKSA